jgi:Spy/CpxP family protein refolding chaperone
LPPIKGPLDLKESLMLSKVSRGIVPVVMAIALVAAVAHVAASSPGGGPMGHGGSHHMHRGMDVLGMPLPLLLHTANLTDAQKQQIRTIFENRRAARKTEMQQLKAAKEAIAAKYLSNGTVTANDLAPSVATITQLHDQMMNERVQDAIAIRNVLTPAQLAQISATKAKLDSIRAEMKSLWAQAGSPGPSSNVSPTPTE